MHPGCVGLPVRVGPHRSVCAHGAGRFHALPTPLSLSRQSARRAAITMSPAASTQTLRSDAQGSSFPPRPRRRRRARGAEDAGRAPARAATVGAEAVRAEAVRAEADARRAARAPPVGPARPAAGARPGRRGPDAGPDASDPAESVTHTAPARTRPPPSRAPHPRQRRSPVRAGRTTRRPRPRTPEQPSSSSALPSSHSSPSSRRALPHAPSASDPSGPGWALSPAFCPAPPKKDDLLRRSPGGPAVVARRARHPSAASIAAQSSVPPPPASPAGPPTLRVAAGPRCRPPRKVDGRPVVPAPAPLRKRVAQTDPHAARPRARATGSQTGTGCAPTRARRPSSRSSAATERGALTGKCLQHRSPPHGCPSQSRACPARSAASAAAPTRWTEPGVRARARVVDPRHVERNSRASSRAAAGNARRQRSARDRTCRRRRRSTRCGARTRGRRLERLIERHRPGLVVVREPPTMTSPLSPVSTHTTRRGSGPWSASPLSTSAEKRSWGGEGAGPAPAG